MPNKSHPAAKAVAGLAALAAAAGAYYFYGSKDAAKHRSHMKTWAVKAKADVMEKLEDAKDMSQKTYDQVVSDVMAKYKKIKQANPKELDFLTKELKGHWKNIAKHLPKTPAKKSAKAKK